MTVLRSVRLALAAAVVVTGLAAAPAASAASPGVVGLGSQNVGGNADNNPAGLAEAFVATATASGALSSLSVYVDTASTATKAVVGVYADAAGLPGALLAQGTITAPVKAAWNTVAVSGPTLSAGTPYWIAVLGPAGAGKLAFRDAAGGGLSVGSSQSTLATLPASWSVGERWNNSPVSAYAMVTPAGPVLTVSPTSVSLSATVGGPAPSPATLAVTNAGDGTLGFTAASDAGWLSVAPTSGSAPQNLTVTAATAGLAAGSYLGHVTITAAGVQGSPQVVPVSLTVAPVGTSNAADWPTVDHDPGRSGTAGAETQIGPGNVAGLAPSWAATLDGKVTAQPLFLSGVTVGGASHDVVIAATNQNTLYSLDAPSGSVLWRRHIVAAPSSCGVPGGFGITGTPVADRSTGRIYAVTDDGALRTIALADGTDAAPALPLVANTATNSVWGGLTLVNGNLYFPTASNGCDQAPWQGGIFQVNVTGATPVLVTHWITVPSLPANQAGGGIWGYGGVSVDTSTGHVYAASSDDATGLSGKEGYTPYAGSLIGLDANLNLLGWYQPTIPANYTCGSSPPCDQDFAATPLVFHPTGCPTMVAAGAKNGQLYVTSEANLEADGGHDASHVQALPLNIAIDNLGQGGLYGAPVYSPATNMVYVTDTGPGLSGISAGLVALAVQPDCSLRVAWSRGVGGAVTDSPNSTPTLANGVVYVGANDGSVRAFDAVSGSALWNSGSVGFAVYAAPTVAAGHVFASTWAGAADADAGTVRAWTPGSGAALGVSPTSLSFSATAGAADPAAQPVSLTSTGGGLPLSFTASSDSPWLGVAPTSGTVPSTLAVQPRVAGLAAGTYSGVVTVTPSQGPVQQVAVSFTVAGASTVPGPPTGVTAVAGNGSATVSWTAPASGGSPITAYTVTPYTAGTALPSTTVTGSPPAASTAVTGLANGTAYTFTVAATNAVGTGGPSAASNPVTPTAVAAPSFVQQASGRKTAASLTVTPGQPVTAGNRLVVEVGVWSAKNATATSVTDSAGNTYTRLASVVASEHTQLSVWSAPITAGGAGKPVVTVTATASADIGAAVLEYAGLSAAAGTGAVDQLKTATGTTGGSAATVASGATGAATAGPELALGLYADSGFGDTLAAGSGWTPRVNVSPTGDMELLAEDQVVAAGASPSATFGTGPATVWLAATVVLKHA